MGIDIPEAAPPEQARDNHVVKEKKSSMKTILVLAIVAVAATAAVLIAVIPDWKDDHKSGTTTETQRSALFYESSEGPFDVKVPLFNSNITDGYSSDDEAKEDLKLLAKSLLNVGITNGNYGMRGNDMFLDGGAMPDEAMDGAPAAPGADDSDAGALDDVSDYSTNNQEFNVDKADFVKSDGKFVFAAYGDHLLVWNADDLKVISKIQMPAIEMPTPPPIEHPPEEGEPEEPMADIMDGWWYQPRPNIQAILLDDTRVTVVVNGYGYAHTNALEETSILYDYLGTHIRVYEINDGDLQLVSTSDVHGSFRNAYSVGQNVHVVTQAGINTWDGLLEPIQRWQPRFEGLDDEAYIEAARQYAEDHLIDPFVDELYGLLQDVDLARFALFVDSLSPDGDLEDNQFADGIPNSLTQVVSFDMSQGEVLAEPSELDLHVAGTLQTGSWGHVYATEGMIIVADQGWSWWGWGSGGKTYLLGFRLDGASSTHAVAGSVAGSILNPYSLDFVQQDGSEYLRIATTQNFWWGFGVMDDVMDLPMDEDGSSTGGSDSGSSSGSDGDIEPEEPEEPEEELEEPVESSTLNQIIVLKMPVAGEGEQVFQQVGNVTLGKPNERFTTVRFFDEFAYAVTFEQTDPFYVVDLATPTEPEEVGALEVPGFSEYLHPIDSDNRYLVAVGQHADDEGSILGLQVSLFDASDPSDPTLVDRLVVEEEDNQWSSSAVSWDARAFRFLKLGERTGKLIIPMTIYGWTMFDEEGNELEKPDSDNFEGFAVFDISGDKITKAFDIDHSTQHMDFADGCYNYGWLPERSFVFSGDVMTMRGYSVVNTDLVTGVTDGTLNLNEQNLGCQE